MFDNDVSLHKAARESIGEPKVEIDYVVLRA